MNPEELAEFKSNLPAIMERSKNAIMWVLYFRPYATKPQLREALAKGGIVGWRIGEGIKKKEQKLSLEAIDYHLKILLKRGLVNKMEFEQVNHKPYYKTNIARAKGYSLSGKGKMQFEAAMGESLKQSA